MLLAPGPEKVSWPRLRRHLGVSRVTTASPDEVERVTGYAPGTVSPLGLATELGLTRRGYDVLREILREARAEVFQKARIIGSPP